MRIEVIWALNINLSSLTLLEDDTTILSNNEMTEKGRGFFLGGL